MAGFELTLYGRIWVTPEGSRSTSACQKAGALALITSAQCSRISASCPFLLVAASAADFKSLIQSDITLMLPLLGSQPYNSQTKPQNA
jgi:hypothetical protein